MADLSDVLGGLVGDITNIASGFAAGITVAVKTNFTPEITVYSGSADASNGSGSAGATGAAGSTMPSLGGLVSKLAGVQVGVVVKDSGGRVLAHYGANGGEPETDWVRVAVALGVIGLLGMGVVVLIRRL